MELLTPRQQQVYAFIKAFYLKERTYPTAQEIADAKQFQFKSANGAYEHIKALIRKNWLNKKGRQYIFTEKTFNEMNGIKDGTISKS